jgi:protein ImuB
LKLLQLELAADPPGAPVTKVWITAVPAPPRSAQCGLFLPATPEAERLEITLARISAVVGERRAGIVRLLDSHRPESFRVDRFAVPADNPKQALCPTSGDINDRPPLAMRLVRPPCCVRVRLADGRPDRLSTETKQTDREALQGQVVWSAGPWRSSGDWWAENAKPKNSSAGQAGPWEREEWDIALARASNDGAKEVGDNIALYRIYRDLATGRWFADASYD